MSVDDSTAEKALIEGLRHDAHDYAKVAQHIPMSHDLEWDERNVRAWDAADLIESLREQLAEARLDLDKRFEHSDHLTAKYHRRMRDAERRATEAQATIEDLSARIKAAIAVEDSNLGTAFYVIVGKMVAILSAPSPTGGETNAE